MGYFSPQNLREDECLWLGQEIQDWLNFIKYSVSPQDDV